MITSRPQTANLLTFILFLFVAWALIVINTLSLYNDPEPPWFNYAVVVVLAPIALFIMYKVFFRYKIITMGNGQITIRWPQFRILRTYSVKDVTSWSEAIIKTGKNSTYKELEISFSDKRHISMAYREYTEYDKMAGYLTQKAAAKKVQV